jgi:predicted helicase
MSNFLNRDNTGLLIGKKGQVVGAMPWNLVFITKYMADFNSFYRGGINIFPLYLYNDSKDSNSIFNETERVPNMNRFILKEIEKSLKMTFVNEKSGETDSFSPIDLQDYIYSILHMSKYRTKYAEFLKTDYPRIPYPNNKSTFWHLVKLGASLRKIHLMESPILDSLITAFPNDGNNKVETVKFEMYCYDVTIPNSDGSFTYPDYCGNVIINDRQVFADVPVSAWEFYIGGYQPAQKWLKDRKGRELTFDEIIHYQKIIVALKETDRIIKEIDQINIL